MGRANPFANNPFGDLPRRMTGSPMVPPTPPMVQPVDVRTPEQKTMDTQQVEQGQQVLQQSDTRAQDLEAINALIRRASSDPSFGTPPYPMQQYMLNKKIDEIMNRRTATGGGGAGAAAAEIGGERANLTLGNMKLNMDLLNSLQQQRATLLGQYAPQRYSQPIQTTVLPGMPMIPGQASLPSQAVAAFTGGLTGRMGENVANAWMPSPQNTSVEDRIMADINRRRASGSMNVIDNELR